MRLGICAVAPLHKGFRILHRSLWLLNCTTHRQVLAYIEEDELVELTPKRITMRKKILDANERKQAARDAKKTQKK